MSLMSCHEGDVSWKCFSRNVIWFFSMYDIGFCIMTCINSLQEFFIQQFSYGATTTTQHCWKEFSKQLGQQLNDWWHDSNNSDMWRLHGQCNWLLFRLHSSIVITITELYYVIYCNHDYMTCHHGCNHGYYFIQSVLNFYILVDEAFT